MTVVLLFPIPKGAFTAAHQFAGATASAKSGVKDVNIHKLITPATFA